MENPNIVNFVTAIRNKDTFAAKQSFMRIMAEKTNKIINDRLKEIGKTISEEK